MANNRPFFRHHEPLPTPSKWGDEERQFSYKLEQLLDELYQWGTKLRSLLRGNIVDGLGLSENNYTTKDKTKLDGLPDKIPEFPEIPVPITQGGTGQTSVAAARNAFGLGNTDGPLPIANGGTGAATAAEARNNLGLGNTDGALPVANGGTGAATVAAARNNLGLGNTDGALPVANGGTGASNAASARTNLDAQQHIQFAYARNSSSVTVAANKTTDVSLNWSREGKTWLFFSYQYAGSISCVLVNGWFSGDTLNVTVRNLTSSSVTIAANAIVVRVGYIG